MKSMILLHNRNFSPSAFLNLNRDSIVFFVCDVTFDLIRSGSLIVVYHVYLVEKILVHISSTAGVH